jgi:hypothetical protein
MLGAILLFGGSTIFLYGILYCFERKKIELDGYGVAIAAAAPAASYLMRHLMGVMADIPNAVNVIFQLAAYPVVYWTLQEFVGISGGRAVAYAASLFIFENVFMIVVLILL